MNIGIGQQLANALALPRIVLDDENPPQPLRQFRLQQAQSFDQFFPLDGLQRIPDGAEFKSLAAMVRHRCHVNGNMPCARIVFQLIEYAESGVIRQVDIQEYGAGVEFLGGGKALVRGMSDHALKAHFMREIAKDCRE